MTKVPIMLAEDHVVVRESIRKFLESEDDLLVVGEAGDGERAVEMAKELHPKVIIMDIDMPKLNGIEATRKIRELCPGTAVLILTAYDYDQYVIALLEAGAAGYLLKDVSGRELIKATKAVSQGETVLHPSIAGKVTKHLRSHKSNNGETVESLTQREMEVLHLAAAGLKNKEIASQLFVSIRTVEAHLGKIFSKLGVTSRTEAILTALNFGLLSLDQILKEDVQKVHRR
ncbi:response regulator transcription factor [Metallumcola ferriviriculae]|uniref:Stage 0 sporulation protein A homolog n=1 Tax=Metallumcola ferriviriculae TaxID=3039180 RepID=A0AAU0UPN2_9FIRM|nr:response regulator transcription factor [Desulfitibacteraceae bacterium MK1]